VYEWNLRRKAKWPVKKLLAKGQQRKLRSWLRYVKSLRAIEEVVHSYEPKAGRNFSDDEEKERLSRYLKKCQVGSEEFSIFQVGNKKRSRDDIKDW
jgi:hypothetical protein